MNDIAWQQEHSVEIDATPSFVWSFLTDVRNWDDPPAQFSLEGPFRAGAKGTTRLPDQDPVRWRLRDVAPQETYVIESPLKGAMLRFEWRLAVVTDRRTRVTQRIVLSGANAEEFAEGVAAGFGANLRLGMEKIARRIADAAAGSAG